MSTRELSQDFFISDGMLRNNPLCIQVSLISVFSKYTLIHGFQIYDNKKLHESFYINFPNMSHDVAYHLLDL